MIEIVAENDCEYTVKSISQNQYIDLANFTRSNQQIIDRLWEISVANDTKAGVIENIDQDTRTNYTLCSHCLASLLSIDAATNFSWEYNRICWLGIQPTVYSKFSDILFSFKDKEQIFSIPIQQEYVAYCEQHEGEHGTAAAGLGWYSLYGILDKQVAFVGHEADIKIVPNHNSCPDKVICSLAEYATARAVIAEGPKNGTGLTQQDKELSFAWRTLAEKHSPGTVYNNLITNPKIFENYLIKK